MKCAGEIMEMLEAFDLTGSLRDAGELAGCSHHTVGRYVAAREAGGLSDRAASRPQLIDEFLPKVEEWMQRSGGKIRADKVHEKLVAVGYRGSERTTRRAVAEVRRAFKAGRVRVHRPWVTEPGMWLQYDFGDGPMVGGVKTTLFCAWLAWARFRVVLAILDKTAPSVFAALDVTLRRLGGAPTYVLTDNEKTVTVEHVAGMAVCNPVMVDFARHYRVTVHTCEPADPASKGGSESTVKLAKADLVPKDTNLRGEYATFAELEAACEAFCEQVNARVHRVTRRVPRRASRPGRGGLGLRRPLERTRRGGREMRIIESRAARGGAGVAGDLDRPGLTNVDDDHGLAVPAAVEPHPHGLPEQGVGHRVLPAVEGHHRGGGRDGAGDPERGRVRRRGQRVQPGGPSGTGKTFLLEALVVLCRSCPAGSVFVRG